ncbi:MAG: sulfotransferase [Armatimonadota bacterium]
MKDSLLVTVIGRGHSGTRVMSHTLYASGVYMGSLLNASGDLVPPEDFYEACRVMARYVVHRGGLNWDFSRLHTMPIDPAFTRLVESYLVSVLGSRAEHRGWKLPETTLVYPWIVRMFPEARYIHWVRDPRDSIMGAHLTDDLADFGVPYDRPDDLREMRAVSWKYQREIVKATPPPRHTIQVRFEDFVLKQNVTLARLRAFLGIPLAKIIVSRDPIGRWKRDEGRHDFGFLAEDMRELGYLPRRSARAGGEPC